MEEQSSLVICDDQETYWHEMMLPYLSSLGPVIFSSEQQVAKILDLPYRLILVDTETIENVSELLRLLRANQPKALILVLSSIPTWKLARTAFDADADDFYRKSYTPDEMFGYIQTMVARPSQRNADSHGGLQA